MDAGASDAFLRAADALGHRGFRNQEGAGDLGGRKPADRAQRQGELGGRGERRMAAHEKEGEGVVVVGALVLDRQLQSHRGLLSAPPGALGSPSVDEASRSNGH